MQVVIVGSGAFAQGLASLAQRSGAVAAYGIVLGSRKMKNNDNAHLPGLETVPVRSLGTALPKSDMVVLALPVSGLPSFVQTYGDQLAGKVVVDVTNATKKDLSKLPSFVGLEPHPASSSTSSTANSPCDVACKDIERDMDKDQGMKPTYNSNTGVCSAAEWLSQVLPSSAKVVKAFCNLSAYCLLHGDPLTEHMKSVAASDSLEAAHTVAEFGKAMGLEMRLVSQLAYASTLEARQSGIMTEWQWPMALMTFTWLVVHIYSFIRYNYFGGTSWSNVTMWILNKSVGWVGLWGMVYTYLPGVLVCYMQLLGRRPSVRLPTWFKDWMDARKQLGLLSLAAVILHLLLSTFLWMPSYYTKLWDHTDVAIMPLINGTALDAFGMMKADKVPAGMQVMFGTSGNDNILYTSSNTTILSNWPEPSAAAIVAAPVGSTHPTEMLAAVSNIVTIRSRLNWMGEASMLLGILSGCLMVLVSLTSLPSITPKMNWGEWRLLQSHTGWWSLITALVHVLLLGAPWWPTYKKDWPMMLPTITLLSTLPVMVVLLLKGLISVPPLSMLLSRVCNGSLARGNNHADPLRNTPVYVVKKHA